MASESDAITRSAHRVWTSVLCLAFLLAALIPLPDFHGALARSDTKVAPLRHEMRIAILPERQRMEVHDVIEIPVERIELGQVTLELANFIAPRFRLIGGADRLRVSSRAGDFGRLWRLSASPSKGSRSVSIDVTYRIDRPKSAQIAVGPRGAFAGSSGDSWYPQISFAQPEIGKLRFRVPAGETVIATGTLVSTPAETAAGYYEFEVTEPVKFAFAAGPYRKFTDPDGRFSIYAFEDRGFSDLAKNTGQLLAFFEQLYGRFRYGAPALVEVDFPTIVLGASEAGFILADDSQLVAQSSMYWAHEFAHQWWGNFVRARPGTVAASLFTEGLAEFSALMALEHVGGRSAVRRLRMGRTADDSPIGRYGHLSSIGLDRSLRTWKPTTSADVVAMHRLATSKAAHVLMMLRDIIGNDAVKTGLNDLIGTASGDYASWSGLEAALTTASGRNLEGFFAQWLGRPGIAAFDLKWTQEGEHGDVVGVVAQRAPHYELPLEVVLIGAGKKQKAESLWLNAATTEFRLNPGFRVVEVRLDPDYRIFRKPLPSDLRSPEE